MVVLLYGIARKNMSLIAGRHESSLHFKCLARVAAGSSLEQSFGREAAKPCEEWGLGDALIMVLAFRGFNSHTRKNVIRRLSRLLSVENWMELRGSKH